LPRFESWLGSQLLPSTIDVMLEILQNKNSATRFQILVEIASSGPAIRQRNIASKLGISPQAVSEYIKQLTAEELVSEADHSSYKITIEGVNWMLKMLRELNDFLSDSTLAIKNITTCAAIAESALRQGQAVGLKMINGLLFATSKLETAAKGITVTAAKAGEDVGVSHIEGLVELIRGKIIVLEVPAVQKGGSRKVDLRKLKTYLANEQQTGVIGIEALAASRLAGIEPRYLFGVTEAAIEQARCGLSFTVVSTSDAIPELVRKLRENNLDYEVVSLALQNTSRPS
jgi:putative transcriptional regulator